MPDFALEDAARGEGFTVVAGVDEAGRGPLAGPVVAAAVVLDAGRLPPELAATLDDSKVLAPSTREAVAEALPRCATIGVGEASVAEIDALNVLQATMLAMQRAVAGLGCAVDLALVDGNRAPALACPARAVVKGDGLSLSIAAASVIAKVTRDRIMDGLSAECPGYGWESNAGYGTAEHRAALARLGVTAHHRRSFAPVAALLQPGLLDPDIESG